MRVLDPPAADILSTPDLVPHQVMQLYIRVFLDPVNPARRET